MEKKIGTIEVGKYADMILTSANPLVNLKSLYGTGAIKLQEDNSITRLGGIDFTIKDGVIFDAKKLLKDVREMVKEAKNGEKGIEQPGFPNWEDE